MSLKLVNSINRGLDFPTKATIVSAPSKLKKQNHNTPGKPNKNLSFSNQGEVRKARRREQRLWRDGGVSGAREARKKERHLRWGGGVSGAVREAVRMDRWGGGGISDGEVEGGDDSKWEWEWKYERGSRLRLES